MRWFTPFVMVMMLSFIPNIGRAQNDPVLAGMIALYTDKAEKELKSKRLHDCAL